MCSNRRITIIKYAKISKNEGKKLLSKEILVTKKPKILQNLSDKG